MAAFTLMGRGAHMTPGAGEAGAPSGPGTTDASGAVIVSDANGASGETAASGPGVVSEDDDSPRRGRASVTLFGFASEGAVASGEGGEDEGEPAPRAESEEHAETGATHRHPSMRTSLFWSFFALAACTLVVCVILSATFMQRSIIDASENELLQECSAVAAVLNETDDPVGLASGLEMEGTRLTLIEPDGTVIYDNQQDPSQMGNHADRPEVVEALAGGTGSEVRSSSTLSEVLIYGARLLDNGWVLRIAISRSGAVGLLANLLPLTFVTLVVLVGLCFVVSRVLARRLMVPLDAIDPARPLESGEHAYREVMPLLRRMDEQRRQIDEQVLRLSDNDLMRVEFTANVTHELKTPLTSISGYAELIETGIAAPADVPEFARRIHDESTHLTALVNDILTLSKMDEAERVDGVLGTCEPVDLAQVAQSVVSRLATRAEAADVRLSLLEGCPSALTLGMSKLVDQLVFNLCDNAIRYNRPGGTVSVRTGLDEQARPYVSVSDTGIGIAAENLEKVFARFYRVDTSRSRTTGGTGLGLAIVKHAARCHDARLDIASELGVGTTVTVTFHAADDDAWLREDVSADDYRTPML